MTIRAVVFDLDGTLADFNLDYKAVRAEVRSFLITRGLPASILSTSESIFEMLEKTEIFLRNHGESREEVAEICREALGMAEKYELGAAKSTSLLPGVAGTLKALKKMGLQVGLFTINSEKSTIFILKRFRLAKFFDAVIPRNSVRRVKPNGEHLKTVLEALKVDSDEAIVIGDGVSDVKCAKELKVIAAGLLTGISSPKELTDSGANYIITSISDLPTLIVRINKDPEK